jgi:uncharacterized phage protein (TIGR02220 family)
MNYYKRHIGDYYKKAGRLSILQHGTYTLLIDACYDREKFPTEEEAIEWVWASTQEEIDAVKFILSRFFTLHDNVFIQTRIQEELDNYHAKCKTNKQIAIARETERKEKSTKRVQDVDESTPNHKPITNNQEPVTINQEPRTKDIMSGKPDDAAQVIDYLNKQTGRNYQDVQANRKLINARLKEGHTLNDLFSVVDRKVSQWSDDPKMAQYLRPATLFNAEKFNQYVGELTIEPPEDLDRKALEDWLNE